MKQLAFVLFGIVTAYALNNCFEESTKNIEKATLVYVDSAYGEDSTEVNELIQNDKFNGNVNGLPGSQARPFRTLDFAYGMIEKMNDAGAKITGVALSKGNFPLRKPLSLLQGISIYGGFSGKGEWKRDPHYITEISNGFDNGVDYPTIISKNIVQQTIVEDVIVSSRAASGRCCGFSSGSSVAVYVDKSPALTLRRVSLRTGKGADGETVKQETNGQHCSSLSPSGLAGLDAHYAFSSVGFQPSRATEGENGLDYVDQNGERDLGGLGGLGGHSGGASIPLYIVGSRKTFPRLQALSFEGSKGGVGSVGTEGKCSANGKGGMGGKGGKGVDGPSYDIFSLGAPVVISGATSNKASDEEIVYSINAGELDCKSLGEDKTSVFPSISNSVASAVSLVKKSTNEVSVLSVISILLALTGVFVFASKTEKKFKELEEQAVDPATMAA